MKIALVVVFVAAAATPAYAEDPACLDGDGVHGYRACPHFGAWGDTLLAPDVFVDFGVALRQFAPSGGANVIAKSTTSGTEPTNPKAQGDRATMFSERWGIGLARNLYMTLDVEVGDIAADHVHRTDHDTVLAGLAGLGVRASVGPFALAAEIAGGGMASGRDDLHGSGLAEVRARAGLWLGPWCTIGVVAGRSIVREGEWMGGVAIGVHTYAYGGER